ncbi:TPA: Ti-type conjugative transfer relaxase TraA [Legionella pneumophila]|uniref:Ti-type conjugative transfer relaxase TraA n=1 Tax=Legionella pneumophila TaxID=446 RepID=UPI000483E12C|nr:Ti-type conjugative transfer relaxase TraA [Legionella pneumophila]MCZ4757823.1 Ti-type conjugative transfer relaxase TraA [Legionella pneumophila]HAT1687750.1 Ti-type conjugative transfer relaxase TraA [Legionella pneumophila]HAT1852628.1 Ti-type conjugative transfer relaxase TraA [Legionella pneumophila]HAT2055785.1 Ti-type conjugative transfer relaxase TraA [Legionella pneumophila]HAT2099955.1 Ti-type conjugative transfer relaxase TraA [Legionella pneumophila]
MAIAFAQVSIHSRAKGHSAIAASSYRSGAKLYDARTGITHDYSNRHDVIYSDILLPEGSPNAFSDREFLWNQAELAEKRCDAQVCKDIVLALPKELDLVQQIELARRFAQTHFVDKGVPADVAIHDHHDGNPHAHILITTRRLEKTGFSKYKARDLNPAFAKGFIVEKDYWGEQWRDIQNEFFLEKNLDFTVDLNHIISERHHGKLKDTDNHYLLTEKTILQQARQEVLLDDIDNVINHISAQHSVFTRRDVERLVFKTFNSSDTPQNYLHWVEQIMGHKDLIELGSNERGQLCYTTRHQYIQEAKLRDDVEAMMKNKDVIGDKGIDKIIKNYTLSDEQLEAVSYITGGSQISVVIGRPGTGKSYLLKPIKDHYEQHNYRVIGAALSGKVAKSLQTDTGIASSTIASLTYKLANQQLKLNSNDVLIIDEAGMVDFSSMALLIREAKKAGSKVILVGDPDQLKPIHKGEIFRGIAVLTGYIELEHIKRQNDLGDRLASMNMAKGMIAEAVDHYHEKGAIVFSETTEAAAQNLIHEWQADISKTNLQDSVVLAFTRASVGYLNEQARLALKEKQILGLEEITFQGFEKPLKIAIGERLLFRQNDKTLGVRNGDLGTVQSIKNDQFQIKLDSGELLTIPRSYTKMDYGYALTVHKSQGMTVKHSKVLIDSKYWDRHLSFVAMTRHKDSLKIYADSINHPTMNVLKQTLSRSNTRDNVIDWPLDFATRAGFNPDQLIGRVLNHIAGVGHKIKSAYNYVVHYEAYLLNAGEQNQLQSIVQARIYAKQEALKIDTKVTERKDKLSKQSSDSLKKHFPQIDEIETLIKKRQRMTGYFAEKADKEIMAISHEILNNKDVVKQVRNRHPELYQKINNFYQKHKEKQLNQER